MFFCVLGLIFVIKRVSTGAWVGKETRHPEIMALGLGRWHHGRGKLLIIFIC